MIGRDWRHAVLSSLLSRPTVVFVSLGAELGTIPSLNAKVRSRTRWPVD